MAVTSSRALGRTAAWYLGAACGLIAVPVCAPAQAAPLEPATPSEARPSIDAITEPLLERIEAEQARVRPSPQRL